MFRAARRAAIRLLEVRARSRAPPPVWRRRGCPGRLATYADARLLARYLMPTTSCAMAATRVCAAETRRCRFLCASS